MLTLAVSSTLPFKAFQLVGRHEEMGKQLPSVLKKKNSTTRVQKHLLGSAQIVVPVWLRFSSNLSFQTAEPHWLGLKLLAEASWPPARLIPLSSLSFSP